MNPKKILLIAALFYVVYAGAVPASPKPFNVTQPDGSIITLHMVGDEYYHWKETNDNQVVVLSEDGYYEYATIINNEIVPSGVIASNVVDNVQSRAIDTPIADREQLVNLMMNKRSAVIAHIDSLTKAEDLLDSPSNSRASSTISLTEGNQKVLCILIDFPDRPFTKSKADFENMWNQTNYNVEGSYGSVNDFYVENSYGHMSVTATVVGPYRAKNNSSYYKTHGSDSIATSNVRDLVKEAIQAAKDDIQFKNFDINEDKFVDAIHIVFAGYAEDWNDHIGLIWSHKWQLSTAVWQGLYRAKEYFITSELAEDYGTKIAPIGTVCHEYGHLLGAIDYYTNNEFTGTGDWDLMAHGSWNGPSGNGRCPAHHNPYTKAYTYNWVTPMIINSSVSNTTYTLTPSHNTTSIYRINTSTNNEFFLLENKCAVANSFNHWVPYTGGLLIYHIHSELANASLGTLVNAAHPQKCYIVCANATSNPTSTPSSYGSNGIESAYPYNGKMFFTSNSMPSAISWAGVATGVDICFIQRDDDNIKFVVNPKINGPEILSTQSTYSVTNVPSNAKIKWTYTFTPSNSLSQMHKIYKPIVFVNGDSTSSVLIERGKYPAIPADSIITGPILPGIKSGDSPFTYVYFSGTAVLKATITSGGYSYSITKTITLSSSSTTALALELEEDTDSILEVNTNTLNSTPLPSYKLRHVNPISSNNAIIYIEKLLGPNNVYVPNDDNYTIEIWHHQLGLIKRVRDTTSNLYLNCGDLPTGVYQMILIIDGEPVAQSKLLKL